MNQKSRTILPILPDRKVILIIPIISNQNQYESMKKKTTFGRMKGLFCLFIY